MTKKRVFCYDCAFHTVEKRAITSGYDGYQIPTFPTDVCKEPHKVYTYSALCKIDSSDNCFVKNANNDCKWFKEVKNDHDA